MAPPKIKDEVLVETASLYEEHKSINKAAKAAGLSPHTFKYRIGQAKARGFFIKPQFELPEGHTVCGISVYTDAEGNTIRQWTKTKEDKTADLVGCLKTTFDEYRGKSELVAPPKTKDSQLLSVYPIADQHIGLLAWGRESGEDYNLDIGVKRLRESMKRLVSQSPDSSQAIILNLGDWQHNDDSRNVTPAHHNILDVDSRYYKILTTGVKLMMDCIELALQKHERVLVRNLPGNHDPHASIALTVALGAFYYNNPRVVVDDDPSDFFFHRFGKTLIGANHGHKVKPKDMAMAMAVLRRKDWGETDFHYFYHGHIHHETAKEIGDVRIESFQTLAARDSFAATHGFTAGQSLTSITIHKEDGESGRHRVNLPRP